MRGTRTNKRTIPGDQAATFTTGLNGWAPITMLVLAVVFLVLGFVRLQDQSTGSDSWVLFLVAAAFAATCFAKVRLRVSPQKLEITMLGGLITRRILGDRISSIQAGPASPWWMGLGVRGFKDKAYLVGGPTIRITTGGTTTDVSVSSPEEILETMSQYSQYSDKIMR